ncbi:MAG: molybdopterin-dependent oxidoreductase [Anaerolineaceae bacterium]|nr:molybdopterin-dependent oxidoreductase [Anaerolineaceae bacterium]
MKKSVLIVLAAVMILAVLAGCTPKSTAGTLGAAPTASGPSLITVKGKIASSPYVLDQAAFDANAKEGAYFDPWVGNAGKDVTEKGILLKDLITLVKPASDAKTVSLIGTDGKAFDIPMADAQKYDIMLAHWVDGALLDEKTGGPVKVAYPKDATTYKPENWAWWIVTVEFK